MDKLLKILCDADANRIIQRIRVNGEMTISRITTEIPDIPRATIYRKVTALLNAGAIKVKDTNKIRGQTENVYAIGNIFVKSKNTNEAFASLTFSIMSILEQYRGYFSTENADAEKDKLFVMNYCLPLNDEDFSEMLGEMLQTVDKYQKKTLKEDAKVRNLYLLSAPGGKK